MTDNTPELRESPLYFISLKVVGISTESSNGTGLFDNRMFSDEIVSSLIYCIDHEKVEIYGFLILSTQLHLIICPGEKGLEKTIESIKSATAQRILHLAGKKMATSEKGHTGDQLWLRRFFSQFINTGVSSFWQMNGNYNAIKIKFRSNQLKPLSGAMLREYLKGSEKNYMHLGAEAFTRLMLESMISQ